LPSCAGSTTSYLTLYKETMMNFITACKEFFGYHEGEGLKQFFEELKALTDRDREDIKAGLKQAGFEIEEA